MCRKYRRVDTKNAGIRMQNIRPTYQQTDVKVEIVCKKWAKAMFGLYYLDKKSLAPLYSA